MEKKIILDLIIISFSLVKGGAGIAADKFKSIAFKFFSGSVEIISQDGKLTMQFIKRLISYMIAKFQYDGNPIKHSLNLFSLQPVLASFVKNSAIIHHLHWFNNDTLSIFDLHKIPSGSIITLHDEWLYCGSEHIYNIKDPNLDFITGYSFFKRGVFGLHLNYLIWLVKKNKLTNRKDLIYTVPSKWMLHRSKISFILKDSDIRYLPNPINVDVFCPMPVQDVDAFKSKFLIKNSDFVFCYGALGGKNNYLKGSHLLLKAFEILRDQLPLDFHQNVVLMDFGGGISESTVYGFRSISVGHIKLPERLALLYSSVDCVVVPSMVESFGQVAAEALSCETPVICFDTSGLKDIVIPNQTGLLSDAFDTHSLANQLLKMINYTKEKRFELGVSGRKHVIKNFSYKVISKKYESIIKDAIKLKRREN